MRRAAAAIVSLAALASCPRADVAPVSVAAPDLETAAILRGLIRDPSDTDPAGLYARDTDRACIVRRGGGYRIGVSIDYGEGIGCAGSGTLTRTRDRLAIDLGGGCAFDADFSGDRIGFPATVPAACARLCTGRATLAALDGTRLSGSGAEAAAMRDGRGGRPCA